MKNKEITIENEGKMNKKTILALLFAIFGLLLFIALALTLPQASSSVPK
jgi:hypothetical protein